MGKPAISIKERVQEFKSDGFYIHDGKIMMCKYCDMRLEFERKDTLKKHIISERHKNSKLKAASVAKKRQLTMTETFQVSKKAKEDKEEFVLDTVEAFLGAGISVEKLNNPKIREWLGKYVKGSGDLPLADRLRQHYIPIVGEKTVATIKEAVHGKFIAILSDETTDKAGNCVFNILFRLMEPSSSQAVFLASSVVLDKANNVTCANAVLDTLKKYEIEYENCVYFVSDAARYMTKCYKTLCGLIGEHLIHTQCWAHKLNLVGQIWQSQLDELNTVVAKIKNVFLNTRKRKHAYIEFLRVKHGDKSTMVKQFPMPVLTRWNSWFTSVNYLSEHLEDIVEFLEELSEENAGVKFIKSMTLDEINVVKIQATFVSENSEKIIGTITFLEGNTYPTAHVLYSKLDDLSNKLDMLTKGVFSENLNTQLRQLNATKRASVQEHIKLVSQKSSTKLNDLKMHDPARKQLVACDKLFNPRNISRSLLKVEEINTHHLQNITLPQQLKVDTATFLEGYSVLKRLVVEELNKPTLDSVDMCSLLCSMKADYPVFTVASLFIVWTMTSNVDAERSFSQHSIIVSDRRRRLKPENAEILTMVSLIRPRPKRCTTLLFVSLSKCVQIHFSLSNVEPKSLHVNINQD